VERQVTREPDALRQLVGRSDASVIDVLRARVERSPDKTFIRCADELLTYGDFYERARRIARFLRELNLAARGTRIATFLGKRVEALAWRFGANLVGGVHVALNREHRGPVLQHLLDCSGAQLLITEASALDALRQTTVPAGLRFVIVLDSATRIDARPGWQTVELLDPGAADETPGWDGVETAPHEVASLLFTSGTTGVSKAALLPHNLFARGAARIVESLALTSDDVFHDWAPLYHIGGQLHMTMSAVCAGAALALFPTFSASRFWSQVAQSSATVACGFANIAHYLFAAPESPDDANNTLRIALIAGLTAPVRQQFERRFGVRCIDSYGMTEAEPLTLPTSGETPDGSCGRVNPDFEVVVADDFDRPQPAGRVGRVMVRPKAPYVMMLRYDRDADATPEATRNLWFRTTDLARFDERGFLYFVDREGAAIKRKGENVSARDIEQVLARMPGVADCAVVGARAPGAFDPEIVAFVVPADRLEHLTSAHVHAFCVEHLARFMIPNIVSVIASLPYSELGKLRRDELTLMATKLCGTRS
jgi:carnitine-CoA ligase